MPNKPQKNRINRPRRLSYNWRNVYRHRRYRRIGHEKPPTFYDRRHKNNREANFDSEIRDPSNPPSEKITLLASRYFWDETPSNPPSEKSYTLSIYFWDAPWVDRTSWNLLQQYFTNNTTFLSNNLETLIILWYVFDILKLGSLSKGTMSPLSPSNRIFKSLWIKLYDRTKPHISVFM
jgi:hypothetical protein